MKKVILKLEVHNNKAKQKAMEAVSSLSGINSISMDMKKKELTVTGDVDPDEIVQKLESWSAEILWKGPAKDPEDKKKDVPESSH